MAGKRKKQERAKEEEIEPEEEEEVDETETEDIYNERERERMLEEDEITEAEEAFMEGADKASGKSREAPRKKHTDTTSVKLAEEEYRED